MSFGLFKGVLNRILDRSLQSQRSFFKFWVIFFSYFLWCPFFHFLNLFFLVLYYLDVVFFWSNGLILFSLLFSVSAFASYSQQIASRLSSNPLLNFTFQLLCFHTQRQFYSRDIHFFCILSLMNVITFSLLICLRVLTDRNRERTGLHYGREGQGRESCMVSFATVFGYFFILVFVFYIRSFVQMSGDIWLSAYRATSISVALIFFFSPFLAGGRELVILSRK